MSFLRNVAKCMERIAPLKLAESWDNVGVLLEAPCPRPDALTVLLTIDLSQAVLDEAIANRDIAVIVAYHPALFRPFKRLTMSDDRSKIALRCAAAGISIFSPHTSLDASPRGPNAWLASGLGKGTTGVITPLENAPTGHEGAGAGGFHTLDESVTLTEAVKRIKAHLGLQHVRLATCPEHQESGKDRITTVAICAGSGADVLGSTKADLYLTGEMSHHEVLAVLARGTSVVLCEHSNTERGYLAAVLRKQLEGLLAESNPHALVICSRVDKDPLVIV
ncbi:hypothetical protein HKX48_008530 [Thoreauomyces humboldtii]|nr:hypothetical protein HKX48_008530 [Thoreauomyces humboldtii]